MNFEDAFWIEILEKMHVNTKFQFPRDTHKDEGDINGEIDSRLAKRGEY